MHHLLKIKFSFDKQMLERDSKTVRIILNTTKINFHVMWKLDQQFTHPLTKIKSIAEISVQVFIDVII